MTLQLRARPLLRHRKHLRTCRRPSGSRDHDFPRLRAGGDVRGDLRV